MCVVVGAREKSSFERFWKENVAVFGANGRNELCTIIFRSACPALRGAIMSGPDAGAPALTNRRHGATMEGAELRAESQAAAHDANAGGGMQPSNEITAHISNHSDVGRPCAGARTVIHSVTQPRPPCRACWAR